MTYLVTAAEPVTVDSGHTAWLLVSSALVLLMAPGLALFYGGLVRAKSVLNMMMMTFGATAVVAVAWVLVGYSVAFGDDLGRGLVGDPTQFVGLSALMSDAANDGSAVPKILFAVFQGLFAIITCALVSGAIADRAKFGAWLVFAAVWSVVVYAPVAHWVFDFSSGDHQGGWLANEVGLIDFAGGTAVEVCSGASALALALVLGRRIGFGRDPMRPHNLTLVMLGAGLLWFGWFGFNAGSALAANQTAAVVFVTTFVAGASGTLGWLLVERFRDGHATSLGAASGLVAGLVAITPSCASLSPVGAIVMGAVAGAVCAYAVGLKYRFGYDDSLDVVGVHMIGGIVGTLGIGIIASPDAPTGVAGLAYGGGLGLLGDQAIGVVSVGVFAFVVSWLLGSAIDALWGFRVEEDHEVAGVDLVIHAESAYDLHAIAGTRVGGGGVLSLIARSEEDNA